MPPKCKAILWDVGGTLVDFRISIVDSVRERISNCGLDASTCSDETIATHFAEFNRDEPNWRTSADADQACVRWAQQLLGMEASRDLIHRLGRELTNYFDMYKPVEGIFDLLIELNNRGLRQVIVSNWPPSLPEFLNHHHLTPHFERVFFSGEDGIHKPDERIYRRALAYLGIAPQDAIFIGDNVDWDILPPRDLGMRAIHFDPRKVRDAREADNVEMLRTILLEML